MKALVTGAGGFVGRTLCRALLGRGDEVRGFARSEYPELASWGVQMQRGDVADAAAVALAVEGRDIVFHVASLIGFWGRYEDFHRTNVVGTQNVIDACRTHAVPRLVYTSTPSVVHDGGDLSGIDESAPYPQRFQAHYPETKALAEQAVLAANDATLATVALRPHLVWGPGDTTVLPRLISRAPKARLVGEPRQVDTCYIDDCVNAHLLAADCLGQPNAACAGRPYFITQDEPVAGPKFMNDLLAAADRPPIERRIPAGVARVAATIVETVWKALGRQSEPRVTRYIVSTLSKDHYYDISAARRDLGYAPGVSYAEGMQRLREWIQDEDPYSGI